MLRPRGGAAGPGRRRGSGGNGLSNNISIMLKLLLTILYITNYIKHVQHNNNDNTN